jgi:hypothetical protein
MLRHLSYRRSSCRRMGGPKGYRAIRPVLATEVVKHVGDRVALAVAETMAQARSRWGLNRSEASLGQRCGADLNGFGSSNPTGW